MPLTFTLDGLAFHNLKGFAAHFSDRVLRSHRWEGNLDAFNDILRGGFGTQEDGFTLRFTHAAAAQEALGWPETIRFLEAKLSTCHPSNRADVAEDLEAAKRHQGQTLFDLIVAIIRDHGPGGTQAVDGVLLELS